MYIVWCGRNSWTKLRVCFFNPHPSIRPQEFKAVQLFEDYKQCVTSRSNSVSKQVKQYVQTGQTVCPNR